MSNEAASSKGSVSSGKAASSDATEPSEHLFKNPALDLAQQRFLLTLSNEQVPNKHEIWRAMLEDEESQQATITKNDMLPFLQSCLKQFDGALEVDASLEGKLREANEKRLGDLKAQIEDAEQNLGESEIREGHLARADYYSLIGDKDKAVEAYKETMKKTVGAGEILDIVLTLIRLGFFHCDFQLIRTNIEVAHTLVENGGDWDRRNRLKVYEGLFKMMVRDFDGAAKLFLDAIATFTCYELFDYKTFIFYTIITSILSLDRPTLKQKVMDSPEVLSVIHEIKPDLSKLLQSLYDSDYSQFFQSLAELSESIQLDRYLAPHARFFVREMRVRAYSQLLQSYRSVQLSSMAEAFNVSVEFIDRELSRFISSGRLHAKIDKVSGQVETNHVDHKNELYLNTIKQGDVLLDRLQKLTSLVTL